MIKKTIIAAAVAATVGALGMTAGAGIADAGVKIFVTPPVIVGPPAIYGGGYWGPAFYFGPTYHPGFYSDPRGPYHCHKWKNKNGKRKQKCHRHS
jgi:hypothetical protein